MSPLSPASLLLYALGATALIVVTVALVAAGTFRALEALLPRRRVRARR